MPKNTKAMIHTHKYLRIKWGRRETPILRCVLMGCTHYLHPEMAIGRKAVCWKCGLTFILDVKSVVRMKPKCRGCSTKVDPVMARLDGLLEGLE